MQVCRYRGRWHAREPGCSVEELPWSAQWCYITPVAEMRGPKCSFSIRDYFTRQSKYLVYCLSCRQCSLLHIGETGRSLRRHFGENLPSIRNNTSGFPVAQHFNSTSHSISDVQVRGMLLCNGTNIQRKQIEMRIIFQLGTIQPNELNINFSFIWTVTCMYARATYAHALLFDVSISVAYFNGFLLYW